jgi:hypothetical protein
MLKIKKYYDIETSMLLKLMIMNSYIVLDIEDKIPELIISIIIQHDKVN